MSDQENQSIQTNIPQNSSTPTLPSQSSKKSRGFLIKIIGGLVIIIFVSTGIVLATRVWDPLWNPFRPAPKEIIEEMTSQMNKLKTVHSRTKFTLIGQEDTKKVFQFSFDSENDSDKSDPQNMKSAGDFYISLGFEGGSVALTGETKNIGEDFYLKLTSLPSLPSELTSFLQIMGINFEELKNQWIKIDSKSFQEKQTEVQQEIIEKIKRLIPNKKFYFVKKELPDKKIGDIKTYHYLVALDKKEFKALTLEVAQIYIDTVFEKIRETFPKEFRPSLEETEKEKQSALSEMEKSINEFFVKIGDLEGEIWIGKKDYLLYKIKGEKEIDLSKFKESIQGKISIKLNIDFSNFNQSLQIEAPKEYKNLEEIFQLPSFSPVLPLSPIY